MRIGGNFRHLAIYPYLPFWYIIVSEIGSLTPHGIVSNLPIFGHSYHPIFDHKSIKKAAKAIVSLRFHFHPYFITCYVVKSMAIYLDEKPVYEYTNHVNKWTVTCHSDGYYGFGSAVTKVLAKKKASYELMLNMLEGAGMDTHKWRAALQ